MNSTLRTPPSAGNATLAIAPDHPQTPTPARQRTQARIEAVARLIRDNGGRVPTQLELLRKLRQLGVKTSKGTVMNDLFALGLSEAVSAYVRRPATCRSTALNHTSTTPTPQTENR